VTGVALVAFILGHVAGNLTLFVGAGAFNRYAHGMHRLGWLLYVVEAGLIACIALHAFAGIVVWLDKRGARLQSNTAVARKGTPSRQTVASRSMLYTGGVLLVFTIVHLLQFRFGPAEPAGYVTTVDGQPARDLYRLVVETFQHLPWVLAYIGVMVFLAYHLRHGIWSAFQSLGMLNPHLRAVLYPTALVASVLVATAFVIMPVYLYLFVPVSALDGVSMVPRP